MSPERESSKKGNESPQHEVRFAAPFAIGVFPITRREFTRFIAAEPRDMTGIYRLTGKEWELDPAKDWRDPGFAQNEWHPVVGASCVDAEAYCQWLSAETGAEYRLPSEAEWEYACRAETSTPFWLGREITPDQANYNGNFVYAGGGAKGAYRQRIEPVDAFEANPWGLYQTHGNVWEWCADAWNDSYQGAPADGSALE